MPNRDVLVRSTTDVPYDRGVTPGRAGSAVADPPEGFVEPAIERIAEMTRLPSGWDGEDAVPPTAPAVAEACRLIVAVAGRSQRAGGQFVVPWTSAPIADGGLQVEWRGLGARIEVQIGPDGSYGYLIKHGEGAAARYGEADDVDFAVVLQKITRVAGS